MKSVVRNVFAGSFVLLVSLFACHSLWRLREEVFGDQSGGMLSRGKVKEVLAEGLFCKEQFVNLNGWTVRLSGRRMCNKRMRFTNGMIGLAPEQSKLNELVRDRVANEITSLNVALKKMNVPFLFVLVPLKIDLAGALVPQGFPVVNQNVEASKVVTVLARRGVRTLDLTPILAATPEDVTRNYFLTDHHWRYRAALSAARLSANALSDILFMPKLNENPRLMEGSWRWTTLPRAFMGSDGRRTGRLFAGLDDFEYAVPRFRVTLERSIPSRKFRVTGDFRKAEIIASQISRKAKPSTNRYAAYTGRDVDVQLHVNRQAPVPIRVMLIKDSFGNPVAAFWATVFKEVVQVDPRKLPKGKTVLDLAKRYRPDVVVEMVNPRFLSAWGLGIQYADLR